MSELRRPLKSSKKAFAETGIAAYERSLVIDIIALTTSFTGGIHTGLRFDSRGLGFLPTYNDPRSPTDGPAAAAGLGFPLTIHTPTARRAWSARP
jgi:hypothetical protein